MATNQKQNDEEVDLGSLFMIIGKGFKNFFNFIGNIFKGIFHILILFLLFVKKHFIKFAVAGLIGGGIGAYLHIEKEDTYASEMLLEPNFESSKQLYFGIQYLANLIEQKDYEKLSKVFDISVEKAESLRQITITPNITEDDIVQSYDELIRSVDTLAAQSYLYENYKKSFTDYDYRVHTIYAESSDKAIFSALRPVILGILEENAYLKKVLDLNNENLNRSDSMYRKDLSQIDSLNKVYMQVLLEEAKKESKGTNIALGDEQKTNKELELYTTKRRINQDLARTVETRSKESQIVNVISDFQPVGFKVVGLENNLAVLGFLLSIGVVLFILGLIELNKYLENYKK